MRPGTSFHRHRTKLIPKRPTDNRSKFFVPLAIVVLFLPLHNPVVEIAPDECRFSPNSNLMPVIKHKKNQSFGATFHGGATGKALLDSFLSVLGTISSSFVVYFDC